MKKFLSILLTLGVFATSAKTADVAKTDNSITESLTVNLQPRRNNRIQPRRVKAPKRWNKNQPKNWNKNQSRAWNRNQRNWNQRQNRNWNRSQNRYWNRGQQNRNRNIRTINRGSRTFNRSQVIRRNGRSYRQVTQYRYLPNGRTQTRVISLQRLF